MSSVKLVSPSGSITLVPKDVAGSHTVIIPSGGIVASNDYATSTVGGTLKARLDGTTLYLSNDGTNA